MNFEFAHLEQSPFHETTTVILGAHQIQGLVKHYSSSALPKFIAVSGGGTFWDQN